MEMKSLFLKMRNKAIETKGGNLSLPFLYFKRLESDGKMPESICFINGAFFCGMT